MPQNLPALLSLLPQHLPSIVWLQCCITTLSTLRWLCPDQGNVAEVMLWHPDFRTLSLCLGPFGKQPRCHYAFRMRGKRDHESQLAEPPTHTLILHAAMTEPCTEPETASLKANHCQAKANIYVQPCTVL